MNIFLKKIGILVISVLILGNLLSYLSLWALRQGNFYKPSFLVNGVTETDFDYIVLGASTGLTTLDTQVIDSLTHKNGINLSVDDTPISSQYLMLKHFLAEGKSTKICVLAPSITAFDDQTNRINANDYRFLPFIDRSYVSDYFQSYSGTDARLLSNSRYLPIMGVSYYNAEVFYPSILSVFQPKRRNRFDAKGNYTYPFKNSNADLIENRNTIRVEFQNTDLKKIKSLCDKEGIVLLCYISPFKTAKVNTSNSIYNIINHSDKLLRANYFYDDIHVTSIGRQLISEIFAEDIRPYFN
ncbi:hypothetical protein [Psychroserpens sp.]|uniref:hypothetical protein n=1 Tax=Psychroserpens sp. TaxID=2020870 RepID=UPI002B26F286|nr:hypothetical protein [Psychroserpens sp.]